MVPLVDLYVYVYISRQIPTTVSGSLTGAGVDISVQSLAIWGIVNEETQYTVNGALTFANPPDGNTAFAQIPERINIYTKLSDLTVYFVRGTGVLQT